VELTADLDISEGTVWGGGGELEGASKKFGGMIYEEGPCGVGRESRRVCVREDGKGDGVYQKGKQFQKLCQESKFRPAKEERPGVVVLESRKGRNDRGESKGPSTGFSSLRDETFGGGRFQRGVASG